jgi:hypothetical protein
MVSRRRRESWTGHAEASELHADSIVELKAEPPPGSVQGIRKSVVQHWQNHHKHQVAGHRPEGPLRRFAEHRLGSVELVGSTVIAARETKQLTLRIWHAAFCCDTSKPMRYLSVMLPIMLRPTIPIGGNISECERVFI